LLLARYGKHDKPVRPVPPVSQATLAEMIGLIEYKDGLEVDNSLLTVVLHD
jgi:hypothetical protein